MGGGQRPWRRRRRRRLDMMMSEGSPLLFTTHLDHLELEEDTRAMTLCFPLFLTFPPKRTTPRNGALPLNLFQMEFVELFVVRTFVSKGDFEPHSFFLPANSDNFSSRQIPCPCPTYPISYFRCSAVPLRRK